MRVLITRSHHQAETFANELRQIGATPVFFPTIAIRSVKDPSRLDQALKHLNHYHWLVFTSANAVNAVHDRLQALEIQALPATLRTAAIGPKTAARMASLGIPPDFVPDVYVSEHIAEGLGDLGGKYVLLPIADIATSGLPEAIHAAGGKAHVITAYHTTALDPDPYGLAALRAGVDVVTFTSGSTARNFFSMVQDAGLDPLNLPGRPAIACIGPKTAAEARALGFQVDILPTEHTVEGLIHALQHQSTPSDPVRRIAP